MISDKRGRDGLPYSDFSDKGVGAGGRPISDFA